MSPFRSAWERETRGDAGERIIQWFAALDRIPTPWQTNGTLYDTRVESTPGGIGCSNKKITNC